MSGKKVVILDGCGVGDRDLAPVLDALSEAFRQEGSEIETFPLHEMKLAHCLGCFGCWVKTPGMCVEDDAGRLVARAVVQSDVTVFFTPVTFGGYSPDLKKMLERFIQILSPYFQLDHREVHHPPRYPRRPRLLMVGIQRQPNGHEAHVFKILAGRNAINFHPPSYAAEVVLSGDSPGELRRQFESLLARSDALPYGQPAAALMPPPVDGLLPGPPPPRRALLLVGSPKTSSVSTSSVLGSYLLDRLDGLGWQTESFTLRAALGREGGEAPLLAAVDRAGLIVLAFPLYGDALPYLATQALTLIAAHRKAAADPPPQRLVAIVNSGFPETHQNAVALAICREFAAQSGIVWSGGLALGGGGIVGAEPLAASRRSGPPVRYVVQALDRTAAALAEGRGVPAAAVESLDGSPIPWVPFALWRRIYMKFGSRGFDQLAAANGVGRDRLLARPYASV